MTTPSRGAARPSEGAARTPRQRDRDARVVAAVARACGFEQPVAPLIVRRVPAVERLLDQDDATMRRVLGDERLRASLRQGLVGSFRDVWRQATLDRLQLEHQPWLRAWWLPVASAAELTHLVAAPPPRSDHRRVGIRQAAFPATVGAAELLLEPPQRRVHDGYHVVERRFAAAILDLAAEVARELDLDDRRGEVAGIDDPPAGTDPRDFAGVGWWHGRS